MNKGDDWADTTTSKGSFNYGVMYMMNGHCTSVGGTDYGANPTQTVNYASCHDNYTQYDAMNYTIGTTDASGADSTAAMEATIASCAAVLFSEGIAFTQGGEEIFRQKLMAKDNEYYDTIASDDAVTLKDGTKLVRNSYMVASFADSDGDGFGDIYGVEQKLDYIKNLGVNVLWLTPIQKSDSYHGYDITDYNAVDPKFGSKVSPAALANSGTVSDATAMADYKSLIAAAHAKGMVVLMDLVLNHTSTGNSWFAKSAQLDATYRGYYQWGNHETQEHISTSNFWYPYGDHVYSYYAKFGSSMPELNYMYAPTRQAVADMANGWCDLGVDGFRMDAVKHIFLNDEITKESTDTIIADVSASGNYSSNLTKNLAFWKWLNGAVKAKHPNAFFVGENFDGNAYRVAPYYTGFDSLFDFYSYFNLTSAAASGLGKAAKVSAATLMTNSSTFATSQIGVTSNGSEFSYANGAAWNLPSVLATYSKYRSGSAATTSGSAIPATFTSNHDIARVINRIHFSKTDANGISAQGNVTSSDYAVYEKAANLVKIAELMVAQLRVIAAGSGSAYYVDNLNASNILVYSILGVVGALSVGGFFFFQKKRREEIR